MMFLLRLLFHYQLLTRSSYPSRTRIWRTPKELNLYLCITKAVSLSLDEKCKCLEIFIWHRRDDLNVHLAVLETAMLPLHYSYIWSYQWIPRPRPDAYKAPALPLSYGSILYGARRWSRPKSPKWEHYA